MPIREGTPGALHCLLQSPGGLLVTGVYSSKGKVHQSGHFPPPRNLFPSVALQGCCYQTPAGPLCGKPKGDHTRVHKGEVMEGTQVKEHLESDSFLALPAAAADSQVWSAKAADITWEQTW